MQIGSYKDINNNWKIIFFKVYNTILIFIVLRYRDTVFFPKQVIMSSKGISSFILFQIYISSALLL